MDLRANAIITAVDRFSGPVKAMAGALHSFHGRAQRIAAVGQRIGSALSGPGTLGASAGGYFFLSQQLAFEEALNRTQAILDIQSRTDFKPLRDKIIDVAKAYPALRTEIAKGTAELAMSGMKIDTIRAVLEQTVQGSMASGESIKVVGEGVTDIVLGMALPFKTASEQARSFAQVNDILAAAATSANDTYVGFLESLRRAGPVSRMVGTDLLSLAAAHGVLANAGIKSERAGIALRTLQVRALAPSKKAREMMRAQGIDWTKWARPGSGGELTSDGLTKMLAEGNIDTSVLGGVRGQLDQILADPAMKSNLGVMGDKLTDVIAGALKIEPSAVQDRLNLGEVVRRYLTTTAATLDMRALFKELADKKANVSVLKELLSLYHVEKAAVLQDAFARGIFDQMYQQIAAKAPGATQRFAAIQMQGFVGAFRRLQSAADAFLDTLASSGVIDTIATVFERLTSVINRLGETSPGLLKWATIAVLTLGVLGPIGILAGGAVAAIGGLAAAFAVLAGAISAPIAATLAGIAAAALLLKDGFNPTVVTVFSAALATLAFAVGPVTAAVVGLGTAAAVLITHWEPAKQFFAGFFDGIKAGFSSMVGWVNAAVDKISAAYARIAATKDAIMSGEFRRAWGIMNGSIPVFQAAPQQATGGDSLPPLARNTDELIRSLQAGPQRVDVQGQATVTSRTEVVVRVEGPGRVIDQRTQQASPATVPLRTGVSLGDIGAP